MMTTHDDDLLLSWLSQIIPDEQEIRKLEKTFNKNPSRITNAYKELLSGYVSDRPEDILSVTETISENSYSGLVSGLNIEYLSFCAHHFLPFAGTVDLVYEPNKLIIGIGKLSRLVDYRTRRFNIQEFIAKELVEDLMHYAEASGAFARVSAYHTCLCYRGPKKYKSSNTVTYSLGSCKERLSEIQALIVN